MHRMRFLVLAGLLLLVTAGVLPAEVSPDAASHWAWQPVRSVVPPILAEDSWSRNELDRFILARLRDAKLSPAPRADKRTLIRRAYFDLIGLPPTPDQVNAFLADDSPQAFAKVVDELLDNPAYGERWGRHWLDIVRYTDSNDQRGMGGGGDVRNAWRYRDWVVNAFNRDYPYNRFLIDQLAGDLLLAQGGAVEQAVATTVLAIGEWGAGDSDKRKVITDIVDDQLDLVSRGMLGMTLVCARCHDHKFDPFTMQDYYAMAGFFFSSHVVPEPGDPTAGTAVIEFPVQSMEDKARRDALAAERQSIRGQINAIRAEALSKQVQMVRTRTAAMLDAAAVWKRDAAARVESLAAERNLDPRLLERFLAQVGLAEPPIAGLLLDEYPDANQFAGWGSGQTPWLLVNATGSTQDLNRYAFPAGAVAVHPSPTEAVGVGWRATFNGSVRISGYVVNGDGNCGNGIAWSLQVQDRGAKRTIAGGSIDNGQRKELNNLPEVSIEQGQMICLLIDPRDGSHACDTSGIGLVIEATDGSGRRWDLATDIASSIHEANPHADSYGNAAVWYLYTQSATPRPVTIHAESSLGKWMAAMQADADPQQLAALAEQVQAAFASPTPSEPDAQVVAAMTNPAGRLLKGLDVRDSLNDSQRAALLGHRKHLAAIGSELAEPLIMLNAVREGGVPKSDREGFADARIHMRGSYAQQTDVVPRSFPKILNDSIPAIPENNSGRLQLAQWVAAEDNPLTARVLVNRIWQHHFGFGLVRTPDNFGALGEPPTHPDLLDYLADRFMESGWSIKAMHRLILNSAAYQQSSTADARTLAVDPDNRLIGRMNRKQLEIEPLRDALLFAAGSLNATQGGPSTLDVMEPRRTIYIRTVRSDQSTFRFLFDAADSKAIVAKRNESIVAPQMLFLMNHPLVLEQCRVMADRLAGQSEDIGTRIDGLYERLYARPATEAERAVGVSLLEGLGGASSAESWQAYVQVLICANEFMYID